MSETNKKLQFIRYGSGSHAIYMCTGCGRLYTSDVPKCYSPRCRFGDIYRIDMTDPRIAANIIEIWQKYDVSDIDVYKPSLEEMDIEEICYKFSVTFGKFAKNKDIEAIRSAFSNLKQERSGQPLISFDWLDTNPEATTLVISAVTQLPNYDNEFIPAIASKYEAWISTITRFVDLLKEETEKRNS